jgi:hypothetical protein
MMNRETKHHSLLANELVVTGKHFHDALAGLARDQWSFQPVPDIWSILLTAEHVALVEHSVARLLTERLAGMPLSEDQRQGQKTKDALVTAALFDRSTRITAPERVQPTGRYGDPGEAAAVFESERNAVLDWLSETELDLRGHGAPHPRLGLLDGKQWLLFSAAHCERHTRQIMELKKDPRYPAI